MKVNATKVFMRTTDVKYMKEIRPGLTSKTKGKGKVFYGRDTLGGNSQVVPRVNHRFS